MCYSAQIEAEYKAYVRKFGARMSLMDFHDLFWRRAREAYVLEIPKAVEEAFAHPQTEQEREIKALIDEFKAQQATRFEQLLFEQKTRLVQAQRKLEIKITKAAQESQRIASKKVAWAMDKLADLRRTQLEDRDSRVFPDWYAPVMVVESGERLIKPMRYHCLPAGKPAAFDAKFSGTFNARRDSLEGFWKGVFGVTHGIVLIRSFFEHVNRHQAEGRALAPGEIPEDVVIEFKPDSGADMLAACIWSRWTSPGQPDLLSFALITDDPPAEVAAVGHDRCVIPIKPEHIDAWLHPDPANLARSYAILDDRQRPYYEHRMAA
jgi:putative SOS response-associated peptidase YedK